MHSQAMNILTPAALKVPKYKSCWTISCIIILIKIVRNHLNCCQYAEVFDAAGIDTEVSSYIVLFTRANKTNVPTLDYIWTNQFANDIGNTLSAVIAKGEVLPKNCILSNNATEIESFHLWVIQRLSERCPTKLGFHISRCSEHREVDVLMPFPHEVTASIAEDYAWHRGWCFAMKGLSDIPSYSGVEKQTAQLVAYQNAHGFDKPRADGENVRLIFLITVYTDPSQIMRLVSRLYSSRHLYVVCVDKSSGPALVRELEAKVKLLGDNIVVISPMSVVYLASSATRILVHGMKWMFDKLPGWDYLVALTGSDYPLQSVHDMETKLKLRNPPGPSIFTWHRNKPFMDLRKALEQSTAKETQTLALKAVDIFQSERTVGTASERRGCEQFGIPLTAENQRMLVRFTSRQSTQVLSLSMTMLDFL